MNDKQIAALVKKTTAKAAKPKAPPRRTYDATLDITRRTDNAEDVERQELFDQMKRREF